MEIVCEHSRCTGCSTCNDICPTSAIKMTEDGEGFIFPAVDQEKCINCKLCQKVCPIHHPERIRENSLCDVDVHEGWALYDKIREVSSSGGIFGQLAHDLLETGKWKVAGVDFDGHRAFHKLISSNKELEHLQNTKYVQSDASLIYKEILKELKLGTNILFSGTPCQVAGCYSYLNKKQYGGQLLTMEVVCHGVPSRSILEKSIEYNKAQKVESFRNKSEGWGYQSQQMTYVYEDGRKVVKNRGEDLFYRFFFGKKKLRTSCYQCPFAKFPRTADVTIGDSWGTTNPLEIERRKGLSLVIANNKKAADLLTRSSNIHLREIGWFTEIQINRNLYTPFPPVSFVKERENTNFIKKQLQSLNCDKFLTDTKLGFNEESLKDNRIKNVSRRIIQKILYVLIGDGRLENIPPLRFEAILALIRIKGILSLIPSEQELAKKFVAISKDVFEAKHGKLGIVSTK